MTDKEIHDYRGLKAVVAFALMLGNVGAVSAQRVSEPAAVFQAAQTETLEIACGPRILDTISPSAPRIVSSQEGPFKAMYGPGDKLIVEIGRSDVTAGQQYFVRRQGRESVYGSIRGTVEPISIHTAGWVRIEAVQDTVAIASVVHACDGFHQGDYLEPFVLPDVPQPLSPSQVSPDYENPGQILFGDEGRRSGGTGQLMVVNRGAEHGILPGQRFTIFRQYFGAAGPVVDIGVATAVEVGAATSMIKLRVTRDAAHAGDLVAVQR